MPWQPAGTFERKNPDFTGATVWQQDQQASIKVIAFRHDDHDEDLALGIADCLNLDGLNAMRATLDMNANVITALSDGVAASDAVNKSQLDAVGGIGEAPIDGNKYSRLDAAWALADGGTNPNDIIVANSWDSQNFISVRASGNFVTEIRNFTELLVTTFKSKGAIRQLLNNQGAGAAAIDVSTHNRHRVNNDADLTMTFSGLPSADDPDLGSDYTVEGRVTILNGAVPGTITLAGLGTPTIIGAQNTDANAGQVLTYTIDRVAGTNFNTVIWSAA